MNKNNNLTVEKIFENALNYHEQKDIVNAEINYIKILKLILFI